MTIHNWISSHPLPTGKDAQLQAYLTEWQRRPIEDPGYDRLVRDLEALHPVTPEQEAEVPAELERERGEWDQDNDGDRFE